MKKLSIFALFLLLIGQTILGPISMVHASEAGTSTQSFMVMERTATTAGDSFTHDSTIQLHYEWKVEGDVTEGQSFSLPFPQQVQVDQVAGEWQDGDISIAYTIADGFITASINEQHPQQSGSFSVSGKLKEEATNFMFAGETYEVDGQQTSDWETNTENPIESGEEATVENEQPEADGDESGNTKEESPGEEENLPVGEGEELTENGNPTETETTATTIPTNAGSITENILTDVELTFEKESDGTPVDKVDQDTIIGVQYKWALENGHGYTSGATFTFQLPSELKVYEQIVSAEMLFEEEVVGYFSVATDGTATIQFTDVIGQYSNVNGYVKVWTEISEETIITGDELIITPIEGKTSIRIPLNFEPGGAAIEKRGTPNRVYNGEFITWTIDVNKNLASLTNAQIVDPIQTGQELKEGSIKLYKLHTKWNGSVEVGDGIELASQSFPVSLGTIETAYRLVFETKVVNEDATKFSNTATLTSDGKEDQSATASVSIQRGKPLAKRAKQYNSAEQSIEWEILYNYNEKKIPQSEAKLTDFFTNSQELLGESFTVEQVTINPETGKESGSVPFTNFTVTNQSKEGKNGFVLSFNQDINKAYKITYKTKSIDRVYEDATIVNEVAAGSYVVGDVGQKISPQILFKSHGTPNYKTKEIGWTIRVNRDHHTMKNVVVTDTFINGGLTFKADTVVVKEAGVTVPEDEYTVVETGDGFTLTFHRTIEKEVVITYNTRFDYESRTDKDSDFLENQVKLDWKDSSNRDRTLTVSRKFTPDVYTQANGFKNGSYNAVTKEITWEIGVNYNLQTLENAVIEDTYDGNQKLLKESITVYKMSLTGGSNGVEIGEAVEGIDYSISYPSEKQFKINFTRAISEPYKVVYNTSVDEVSLVAASYNNTAILKNNGSQQWELNATVPIPNGGSYIKKSGVQNGMVIDWKLDINFAQSNVHNAEIYDVPDGKQVIMQDTFKLYKTVVSQDGSVEKQALMEKDVDYTLSFTEDPDSFTLNFLRVINEPYILEYQTRILAAVGEDINNGITFIGDNITTETGSSETFKVKRTNGMGAGTGEVGRLTVIKRDGSTGELLKGAKFALIDNDSGATLATAETNEDGEAFFNRLLYGNYLLKEIQAPVGYLAGADQSITIDSPYEKENADKPGNKVTVNNTKLVYEVQLQKFGEEGNVLAGAVFMLQKATENGFVIIEENLITDEHGLIIYTELDPGSYRFVETKAPLGYQLLQGSIGFEIEEDATVRKEVTATNIKKGSALLKKVDSVDNTNTLTGAEFRVEDENGNIVRELVRTKENGEAIVQNLDPGTYYFIETKAPEFYQLDHTPIKFVLEAGSSKSVQVEVENTLITRDVQLEKVDASNPLNKLSGATFEFQYEDGTFISEHTTNDDGLVFVKNLAPGSYQFVETVAPEGYVLDTTPLPFTVEKSSVSPAEMMKLVKSNTARPGSVVIQKVDSVTGEPLAGVEFQIETSSGDVLRTELVTNKEGQIDVTGLAPGNYQLVETKPLETYKALKEPIPFTIIFNQQEPLGLKVENTLIPRDVQLLKIDAKDETKTLSGATFELQHDDGTVISTHTTNADGIILVENLAPGTYQFVETKAPNGYELNAEPLKFTVETSEVDPAELLELRMENSAVPGDVRVKKVDRANGNPLAGAKFRVEDASGTILDDTLVSDENGLFEIKDLYPGSYKLVETVAPSGYLKLRAPIEFTIEVGQTEILELTVENTKESPGGWFPPPVDPPTDPEEPEEPGKPGKPTPKPPNSGVLGDGGKKLPQTGEAYPIGSIALGILFILLGSWLVGTKKIRNRKL
ncbi:SpaA isopeptide-forming pilin-related protein [Sporosarcina saromensis]|uniref:SpaA isopeptide-forming pilin-related protein n=1 Tax=Sporosarcina saromensis TaxID=359365 RepID=A0ABU4G9H8_9BACL|nr:SpaA isopeptide-forming pilin-related protein [Sporosarcina saromensis]MDW0113005.1 SpaA isopeptide-forming pilin-related protein [Sporosarcina saromensis]